MSPSIHQQLLSVLLSKYITRCAPNLVLLAVIPDLNDCSSPHALPPDICTALPFPVSQSDSNVTFWVWPSLATSSKIATPHSQYIPFPFLPYSPTSLNTICNPSAFLRSSDIMLFTICLLLYNVKHRGDRHFFIPLIHYSIFRIWHRVGV